ncbi:MAG: glutamate--cysteine ligase [Sphingomonadales bacterium]
MGRNQTLENKRQLVEALEVGIKSPADFRIGTEHEKFCFDNKTLKPLPYEGEKGIHSVLQGFSDFDWEPVFEKEKLIALKKNGASITLEPAGQLELSGAPLETIHQTCDEVSTHLYQAKEIGEKLGIGFLGLGFHPTMKRSEANIMPKARYDIMQNYMPGVGTMGLDMMTRTTTVQVNLDFSSEADMVKKFRVGLALQPLATALFANSPFTEGKPSGFKSLRSHAWTKTDNDRTGMLPFVFDEGFGFERYVDYALDVPMYFVYRDDYINAAGQSFRDFMAGKLPAYPGHLPRLSDWEDHLTTLFPEVRLKTFLEMRGADGGSWSRLCALPAFWVGLLYDNSSLDAAWDLVKGWSTEEMAEMRANAPRLGFETPWQRKTFLELAGEVLKISDAGLRARNFTSNSGESEHGFLQVLWSDVEKGKTPADELLDLYVGAWKGDLSNIFRDFSY